MFRIEAVSKSGRVKCKGCDEPIALGNLKYGAFIPNFQAFGGWKHLRCVSVAQKNNLLNVYNSPERIDGWDELKDPQQKSQVTDWFSASGNLPPKNLKATPKKSQAPTKTPPVTKSPKLTIVTKTPTKPKKGKKTAAVSKNESSMLPKEPEPSVVVEDLPKKRGSQRTAAKTIQLPFTPIAARAKKAKKAPAKPAKEKTAVSKKEILAKQQTPTKTPTPAKPTLTPTKGKKKATTTVVKKTVAKKAAPIARKPTRKGAVAKKAPVAAAKKKVTKKVVAKPSAVHDDVDNDATLTKTKTSRKRSTAAAEMSSPDQGCAAKRQRKGDTGTDGKRARTPSWKIAAAQEEEDLRTKKTKTAAKRSRKN